MNSRYKIKVVYFKNDNKFCAKLICIESDPGCSKYVFHKGCRCGYKDSMETDEFTFMEDLEKDIKNWLYHVKRKIELERRNLVRIDILEF